LPGFHRKIIFASRGCSTGRILSRACLEDDFHRFRLEMTADDTHILEISGSALRYPYSTCPQAVNGLDALIGQSVADYSASIHRQTDASLNCTHLLDLAGLCCSHIKMDVTKRQYEIFISDRHDGETTGKYKAQISQNGQSILSWDAENETIFSPYGFQGVNLRAGFAKWAFENLDMEMREIALILRRCAMISMGRAKNLKEETHAADWGFCYSQQKDRAHTALRVGGSIQDFNSNPSKLCEEDTLWINDLSKQNVKISSHRAI